MAIGDTVNFNPQYNMNWNTMGYPAMNQAYNPMYDLSSGFSMANGINPALNFNNPSAWTYTATSPSSTSVTPLNGVERYEVQMKRRKEELKKIQEEQKAIDETRAKIAEAKAEIANKNEDGSVTKVEKLENMTTWGKTKRALGNVFSGIWDTCKSIVGFEKDGKWNPMKCLRNVAIAVGTVALCVFAAPVAAGIAGALGASAATTTAVAAGTTAVVSGLKVAAGIGAAGYGIYTAGKGIHNACNAKTTQEFDEATQSVGQGTFVAAASLCGLRSMSKAAGVAAQSGGCVSRFVKDAVINPFKVPGAEANAVRRALTVTTRTNTAKVGFGTAFKTTRSGIKNLRAKVKMKDFNKSLKNTKNSLNETVNKYSEAAAQATDAKTRALYEMQVKQAQQFLSKIKNAQTRKDWKALKTFAKDLDKGTKQYKWYHLSNRQYDINGQILTKADLKMLHGAAKNVSSQVNNLANQKFTVMSNVTGASKYADVVNKYYDSPAKWYSQPYNWGLAKYDVGVTKGQLICTGFSIMAPEYILNNYQTNPMFIANNALALAEPCYQPSSGETISAEQVKAQEEEIDKASKKIQKQELELNKKRKDIKNKYKAYA